MEVSRCPPTSQGAFSLHLGEARPISLTPVLSKVLEHFVASWVMEAAKDTIDKHQFGSMRGSSTVHALIELVHQWQQALDTPGRRVRLLFLDFSKAFDRVDHTLLLQKIANLGIPDFLVRWLTSFLCHRQQRVKLGTVLSEWTSINAGIPQGTVLGPIGFLLHINDLQTICRSVKYVDDTTIWEACATDFHDSNLQTASDQAAEWSKKNLMKVNSDKSKTMEIAFSRKDHDIPPIRLDGEVLESVQTFKLLGVIISSDLSWSAHVDYLHGKCSSRENPYGLRHYKNIPISRLKKSDSHKF